MKRTALICMLVLSAFLLIACSDNTSSTVMSTATVSQSPEPVTPTLQHSPTPVPSPAKTQQSSSAVTTPEASPNTTSPSPADAKAAGPSPRPNFKVTDEAAAAYLQIIGDKLDERDKLFSSRKEYIKMRYSGTLFDLNGDGQDELIMAYGVPLSQSEYSDYICCYQIFSYKSHRSVFVGGDFLCDQAGDTRGGLSLVNYMGESYLCVWHRASNPADTCVVGRYSCELFSLRDTEMIMKHSFEFVYFMHGWDIPLTMSGYELSKDGSPISYDEFLEVLECLNHPITELCTIGQGETNYQLSQLYEDLKNR